MWANPQECQNSEYGRVLNMQALQSSEYGRVLNMQALQSSEYSRVLNMQELHRVLNLSEQDIWFSKKGRGGFPPPLGVRLWVWLNMHQYPSISLNILENAWINYSGYVSPLKMLCHFTCSTGFWISLVF